MQLSGLFFTFGDCTLNARVVLVGHTMCSLYAFCQKFIRNCNFACDC